MSEFETVNLRKGARELEVLRAHYRRHRAKIEELIADAPTDVLANEYRALIDEIDTSLRKLDEIESHPSGVVSAAGMQPLDTRARPQEVEDVDTDSRSRLLLIAAAALIALAAIGWFIWKASKDRNAPGTVVETTSSATTAAAETTSAPATIVDEPPVTPAPAASVISVSPRAHDYGVIRKGTRATRQFEIANDGEQPVSVSVARSACRCLYYEYNELVPPKGKETVTVTVDGAKAKAGALRETIRVTGKRDPSIATSFDVSATIR